MMFVVRAWRKLPVGSRRLLSTLFKLALTAGAFYLLLAHEVRDPSGAWITTFEAIRRELPSIDVGVFWRFCLLAAAIKFVGISCSIWRWHTLLRGQGIRFPVWHLVGTFLIGRFLGTFLPSTIGLDGYKLWDAARWSRRGVEAAAATAVEKPLGLVGIFLSFLVAAPFGAHILGARSSTVLAITVPLAVLVIAVMLTLLLYPAAVQWAVARIPSGRSDRAKGILVRVSDAAAAYRGKVRMLFLVLAQSFSVHFTTAAMYFCTALAVGAAGTVTFWESTFASTVQIFATVVFPLTVGGEGIREIVHAYMLEAQMGAQKAVLAAALGFWSAEALTLFGGFFWLARRRGYRPKFVEVGGAMLDLDERPSDRTDGPGVSAANERVVSVPS
ncbi:MAG: flippase-like domain-containing protein [Deltaproteobacteria bacterium]|nr:flippase-like domain-containing protein [Deltaproteobacteria bacterium]